MLDSYSPILGLLLQFTGNNNNNWGDLFNQSTASPIERALAGVAIRSDTGGTIDLSIDAPPIELRKDIDVMQLFNGALNSDLTVIVPNLSKVWWFQNDTTGGFFLYVKTPTGNQVQIPQGCGRMVLCDGAGRLMRQDQEEIGAIRISAKATVGPGELACDGSVLLRTAYPDLFNVIGTTWGTGPDNRYFQLPNFTDTGRFLRSASATVNVGTYQANQNRQHNHAATSTFSGSVAAAGDHYHYAYIADPGHVHTYQQTILGAGTGTSPNYFFSGASGANTGGSFTGSYINSVANGQNTTETAGSHTHAIIGAGVTTTTESVGGTEAHPESAVVTFGIRY